MNKAGSWDIATRVVMVSKHFIGFSKRISNILENNILLLMNTKLICFKKLFFPQNYRTDSPCTLTV